MAGRRVEEIFGPSVLDLVCGLFGLLVVLFSITEQEDGGPPIESKPINFLNVESKFGYQLDLIVSFELDGETHSNQFGCDEGGVVIWKCDQREIKALIDSDSVPQKIKVAAKMNAGEDVEVKLTTRKFSGPISLCRKNFYRGAVNEKC